MQNLQYGVMMVGGVTFFDGIAQCRFWISTEWYRVLRFVFVLLFAGKFLGILLTEASLSGAGLSIFAALAMLCRSCQASFHIQVRLFACNHCCTHYTWGLIKMYQKDSLVEKHLVDNFFDLGR